MIQGIPEATSAVLSFSHTQGSRGSNVTKPISEEPHSQPQKAQSQRVTETEDTQKPLSSQSLEEVVANVQDTLKQVEPRVQLSVDEDLNRVVVKVVDSDSGELIRQIPPEEVLQIQKFFNEKSGIFVKEEA